MTKPDIAHLISQATARLSQAGIATPRVDAELLAAHVAHIDRGELQAAMLSGRELIFDAEHFDALVSERSRRVPLQHLVGYAPFRSLMLAVGPGVFIPRPETEQVAQYAIDAVHGRLKPQDNSTRPQMLVDLCSGSGAIAFALVTEVPNSIVHGVEFSTHALAWAEHNQRLLAHEYPAVLENLTFHQDDATRALPELEGQVDVVVSNPPYIPPDQVPIEHEVREHDPEIALYGRGTDGLTVPRGVLNRAAKLLRPDGEFFMEHAETQAQAVRDMARSSGMWRHVTTLPDLSGRDRMLYAVRTKDKSGRVVT